MCSPLGREVCHVQASFVTLEEQNNPITTLPSATSSILFTQAQDLCGVSVMGSWLPTSLFPSGRRAELPHPSSPPLSKTTQGNSLASCHGPDRRKPGLATQPPCRQQKAIEPEHLTVGLSPGADAASMMADHQRCQRRLAGDWFQGLHIGRVIKIKHVAVTQQIFIELVHYKTSIHNDRGKQP